MRGVDIMAIKQEQKLIEIPAAEAKNLAEPVDFEALEREGILTKSGAWYRVQNLRALPASVRRKIRDLSQDSKGLKARRF
jgi:hypothetical protein